MSYIEQVVQGYKQRVAQFLHLDHQRENFTGIPPAAGEERAALQTQAEEIVLQRPFAFRDFIETMRGLVGLIRPDGASRGFSYQPGLTETYSYVEFNSGGSEILLDLIRHRRGDESSFMRRTTHVVGTRSGFELRMPSPITNLDKHYLKCILGVRDKVETYMSQGLGKGAIRWARAPLSKEQVRMICVNVFSWFTMMLPSNYAFLNGEGTYLKNTAPIKKFFK